MRECRISLIFETNCRACKVDSPNFDGFATLRSLLFKFIQLSTSGKTSNTWDSSDHLNVETL